MIIKINIPHTSCFILKLMEGKPDTGLHEKNNNEQIEQKKTNVQRLTVGQL